MIKMSEDAPRCTEEPRRFDGLSRLIVGLSALFMIACFSSAFLASRTPHEAGAITVTR